MFLVCERFLGGHYIPVKTQITCVDKQLDAQRRSGAAFGEFLEGPLTFDPTYKYDNGSTLYDTRYAGLCVVFLWWSADVGWWLIARKRGFLLGLIGEFFMEIDLKCIGGWC